MQAGKKVAMAAFKKAVKQAAKKIVRQVKSKLSGLMKKTFRKSAVKEALQDGAGSNSQTPSSLGFTVSLLLVSF